MSDTRSPISLFKSGGTWLLHFLIEHWVQIILAGGSALMTFLASLANWLKIYGPVAWGAVGLGTYLILMIGYACYGIARKKIASSRLADERWKTEAINPLDGNFIKRRIKLSDFFNPFYEPVETARFHDCELIGPANILLMGGTVNYNNFLHCQAVIVIGNKNIIGVTAFKNCIFERCKFYQVTFYMVKEQYITMKGNNLDLEIISDGKTGDL